MQIVPYESRCRHFDNCVSCWHVYCSLHTAIDDVTFVIYLFAFGGMKLNFYFFIKFALLSTEHVCLVY